VTDEAMVDVGRGIELCYDTFGDEAAPPVVLVAGLGSRSTPGRRSMMDHVVVDGDRRHGELAAVAP
jgi:hypothetical protein